MQNIYMIKNLVKIKCKTEEICINMSCSQSDSWLLRIMKQKRQQEENTWKDRSIENVENER